MDFRIGDQVVCGEIINTSANTVHGWLELRDVEQPVALQLTGNPGPEMAGRHIRFEVRDDVPSFESPAADVDMSQFSMQQVGPTGTMTFRRIKVSDGSVEELDERDPSGKPRPERWKNILYLEWFSQNGRVVLELVDPKIEYVDPSQSETEDEPAPDPEAMADDSIAPTLSEDEDDDPYGLFPEDLQSELETESTRADHEISPLDEDDPVIQQMMLMDELIENGEDVPVGSIFDPPIKLHPAQRLDDDQVERALKMVLARLATHGIALDMCEHYTPRAAYELLLETILTEEGTFPELSQTGFVQHFMTHEYCDACDAEMEQHYEENEQRRPAEGTADDPPEDEPPWLDDPE